MRSPPSDLVLARFGASDVPQPMAGGRAWRAGEVVLKRADAPPSWLEWEASVLATVPDEAVRLQRPIRADDGSLEVDGWVARSHLRGAYRPRWTAILEVAESLNQALAAVPTELVAAMPQSRTDPWAIADRIAWDEAVPPPAIRTDDLLEALLRSRRPVDLPAQVVHGDLSGNVLFDPELGPAVIDFSAYRRPATYALGIVVADAVVWNGADLALADELLGERGARRCLLRALVFRHVTGLLLGHPLTGSAIRRLGALARAVTAADR